MKLLAIATLFLAGAAIQAHAQSATLEGYVYNQHTGVPLRSAEILISRDGSLGSGVARPVRTDSSGYFSVAIPDRDLGSVLQITATCRVRVNDETRVVQPAETHPFTVREGVTQRNLFIPASRRRFFDTCVQVYFPVS